MHCWATLVADLDGDGFSRIVLVTETRRFRKVVYDQRPYIFAPKLTDGRWVGVVPVCTLCDPSVGEPLEACVVGTFECVWWSFQAFLCPFCLEAARSKTIVIDCKWSRHHSMTLVAVRLISWWDRRGAERRSERT